MLRAGTIFTILAIACLGAVQVFSQPQILRKETVHLRNGGVREWTEFSKKADPELKVTFSAQTGVLDHTLEFTQRDVKQLWRVLVNGVNIGALVQDEKRLTTYLSIPATLLKSEGNVLTIRSDDKVPDDITVGDLVLHRGPVGNLMSALIEISITDSAQAMLPARITIVNDKRSLQTVTASDTNGIAIRPGCVYTAHPITLRLPAPGNYTIYANRGFEYSVDSVVIELKPGDSMKHRFMLQKEVDTEGWISSDTHVHTFTYSSHGDASVRERVLTLAGEGIELPVMTDHNVYVDLIPTLDSISHRDPNVQMTPVIGDEVTTAVGHFNVFDIPTQTKVIDHRGRTWSDVGKALTQAGTGKIIILNHSRDVHNNFRPFGPTRHVSSVGLDVNGWTLPANAMEVINSGSQQSDFMLLFQDWFGMLNAGNKITPIGSSDSHDVNRFIVGQGRTYIKGNDEGTEAINIAEAIRTMANGQVMVSCGLLTKILVNKTHGPGELTKETRSVNVRVEVLGPGWSNADSVILYMNGVKVRKDWVSRKTGEPIFQAFSWDIDLPSHDVYFAAIAHGKIGDLPYWPIAKPYQPMSPDWTARVYAGTGAVWVDADGNNRQDSAADYAKRLIKAHGRDLNVLIGKLNSYDETVAMQVAVRLWKNGEDLRGQKLMAILSRANDQVRRGFSIVAKEVDQVKK